MTPALTFAESCLAPDLFGRWFDGPSWAMWRVLDKAIFGEPLSQAELATFLALTGRTERPDGPVSEGWLIIGRRGGKDVKASALVVYLAAIGAERFGWRKRLVRGERGVVQLLAVDRDQAKVCLGCVKAMFEQPLLAPLVARDTADGVELTNGLAIEITTNDQRRVRGRTVIAAVFDELAFWRSENTANPDEEVYRAVKPAMATIPGAMLIAISSPYAQRGLLFKKYKANWGKPGRVLVVRAATWVMNPTLPRDGEFLTQAFEEDPAGAAAEYGAEFRTDVETFVSREAVEACVDVGVFERPPIEGIAYMAFVDPSGGRSDAMTMAVAHREGDRAVLDLVREVRAPFNPEAVVAQFAADLSRYRCSTAKMDRYGAEWVRTAFARHGIDAKPADKPKSDLYAGLLPPLNSGLVSLLDVPRLVNQLCTLERRTARGGRDTIDHAPGAHDDLANAVAGAVGEVLKRESKPFAWYVDGKQIDATGKVISERPREPYLEPVENIRDNPWRPFR